MDKLVVLLMVHWIQTPMQSESVILPSALILYLNERRSNAAVKYLFRHMVGSGKDLWRVVTQTLAKERQDLPSPSYPERMEILMALWRSLSLGWRYRRPSTSEIHQMLQVVMDAEASARSLTLSITAQLKWRYLDVLFGEATTSNYTALFTSPMLPIETAVTNPQDGGTMEDLQEPHEEWYNLPTLWGNRLQQRIAEAHVAFLAEFLKSCADSDPLPYKAEETLKVLHPWLHIAHVHETHQLRLANAVQDAFENSHCLGLRTVVINSGVFGVYAGILWELSGEDPRRPWFDYKIARDKMKKAFSTYADELSSSPNSEADLGRVRAILQGFDHFHPSELQLTRKLRTHC
jgi:hypothetical protein